MYGSNNVRKANPFRLSFEDVSEEDIIKGALQADVAVFLHGKPGCGKSARVKQLDPDFIELNLTHLDPELLDGLAGVKDGVEVHIKPPWLNELEEACTNEQDRLHIVFLDEVSNASRNMQSKAYGIALDKKVAGRWKLPDNARVVAAGNEIEDSLAANEVAEPLFDRFAHVYIETTVEGWLEWAVTPPEHYERLRYRPNKQPQPKIHPAIFGYIKHKGDLVFNTPFDRDNPKPHANPRRWEMASKLLSATANPQTLRAVVGQYLTNDFIEFCKMPRITIADVLARNYNEDDIKFMSLGEKIATVSGLVRVDEKDMPIIRQFVKKLGAEMLSSFESQWAAGDIDRLDKLEEAKMEENNPRRGVDAYTGYNYVGNGDTHKGNLHGASEAAAFGEKNIDKYSDPWKQFDKYLMVNEQGR